MNYTNKTIYNEYHKTLIYNPEHTIYDRQKGQKNAVLLPIPAWDKIQRDLEAFEKLKDKRIFFEGLANAFLR